MDLCDNDNNRDGEEAEGVRLIGLDWIPRFTAIMKPGARSTAPVAKFDTVYCQQVI